MTDSKVGGGVWKTGGVLVTVRGIENGLLEKPSFTYTYTLKLPTSVRDGVISN